MIVFTRPEHRAVARLLQSLDASLFNDAECFFGGGTAIVLQNGEYRLSRDVDFLCSSVDGYRKLRLAATERGTSGLFRIDVRALRPFRIDQYGIRTVIEIDTVPIRFEIVREARIVLSGGIDPSLGCPVLTPISQVAEKLLANADRCQDPSTGHRDAVDLGVLARALGGFPAASVSVAEAAYGRDVGSKARWAATRLTDPYVRAEIADALTMTPAAVESAAAAFVSAVERAFNS